MNHKVNPLLTKAPLKRGIELEFTRQRFLSACVRFHIEVNVATAQVIPHSRAKQQGMRFGTKMTPNFFSYGLPLLIGESHFGFLSHDPN